MLTDIALMSEAEIENEIKMRLRRMQIVGSLPCDDTRVLRDKRDPYTRVFIRNTPDKPPGTQLVVNPTPPVVKVYKPKPLPKMTNVPDPRALLAGGGTDRSVAPKGKILFPTRKPNYG